MITLGRLIIESNNPKIGRVCNEILEEGDLIIWCDKFNRQWKLTPVTNENIKFPFIIEPIGDKR